MEITRNEWNKLVSMVTEIKEDVSTIKAIKAKEKLTPKEVQEILGIGKTTYQRYVRDKIINQTKIKGKAYVQRSEIESLMEEGRI
jgi:hypothetical protein